jgi:hypothetical protein
MRLGVALLIALFLAVPAAAGPDRSTFAPSAVGVLAADGAQIAFLSPAANRGCGAVGFWSPSWPAAKPLGRVACGPRTSTGRGAYGLSYGQGASIWVTYTGGNFREHRVWRGGRVIDLVRHEVDLPAPLVVGQGATYAVDDRMTLVTPSGRKSWTLPERPLGLSAGKPFALARLTSGPVVLLQPESGEERVRFEYAAGVARAARVSGSRVVVLRAGELDVLDPELGLVRTWPVPSAQSYGDDHCGTIRCPLAALRLSDLDRNLAVYVHGNAIHVLRVSDGKDVVVRRPASPVRAQLEPAGLSYSSGRRVAFIPRSELVRLLRSA